VPNPFAKSRTFHKLSNIFVSPMFRLLPMPRGFALLTVTGRASGKPRRRPIRAIRRNETLYAVAILGERSDWLRNVRANPEVRVKIGARTGKGTAREVTDEEERASAAELYAETVVGYDYVDYPTVHWAFPTPRSIRKAHREWVEGGTIVAVDLPA
jgi:deazaflavin-dependent oxidoreductase (nitroreductase family)